jgi:uncharacterized membrane protein
MDVDAALSAQASMVAAALDARSSPRRNDAARWRKDSAQKGEDMNRGMHRAAGRSALLIGAVAAMTVAIPARGDPGESGRNDADPCYKLINLALLGGDAWSEGAALNDAGAAVGFEFLSPIQTHEGCYWAIDGVEYLPPLRTGHYLSSARDLNESDQAAGWSSGHPMGGERLAVRWTRLSEPERDVWVAEDLGLPSPAEAWAINNLSRIVGFSFSGAFLWDEVDGATLLPPNLDDDYAMAHDLAEGEPTWIVGYSDRFESADQDVAVLWEIVEDGISTMPLPWFGGATHAYGISDDRSFIVGAEGTFDMVPGERQVMLWVWENSREWFVPIALGTLGGSVAEGLAVNDDGIVVGNSETAGGGLHGFVAQYQEDEPAELFDLNDVLLPTQTDRWVVMTANDVNASGRIAGTGIIDGELRAILLNPCPADVNLDDVVDVSDLLDLIAGWGLSGDMRQDVNGNAVVDVLDLLDLLAAWGPCG